MKQSFVACAVLLFAGCAPAPEETTSPTTSATETSSTTTTAGAGAGTTTEPPKPMLQASFVAEDEAGAGPALLRMFNDTPDQILSLTLDDNQEYALYLIDPLGVSDYALTMSDDMLTDAILSIHTFDTCVRKPFAEMTGPMALEPGHAYAIRVSIDGGFIGKIEEEAAPDPFIGVRAHVSDPAAATSPAPSDLVLSAGGTSPGDIQFKTIFTEFPEPYVRVAGSKIELEKIRFVDRTGVAHESSSPIVLEGSPGYTVYIDDQAQDGAEIVIPLDDLLE